MPLQDIAYVSNEVATFVFGTYMAITCSTRYNWLYSFWHIYRPMSDLYVHSNEECDPYFQCSSHVFVQWCQSHETYLKYIYIACGHMVEASDFWVANKYIYISIYASERNALYTQPTLPVMKKDMQRFCFIIGGFSLRATSLEVNGVYLVWRFSFITADFSLKVTSL